MDEAKQIMENIRKRLNDEKSDLAEMVVTIAYLHAWNYILFGVDVTEKWKTATQNSSALEKAYRKGYYDGLQRQSENEQP